MTVLGEARALPLLALLALTLGCQQMWPTMDTGADGGAPPAPGRATGDGGIDLFGVAEIYPSAVGGEHWEIGDPRTDPRAGVGEGPQSTFTPNADGSWKVAGGQGSGGDVEIRWGITTSSGFREADIATLSQQQLAARGYMLHPNDWKNVEMTGYWRINTHDSSTANGEAHIESVIRGGRNTEGATVGGYDSGCEGTSYHSNTYPITGRVKMEKDLDHRIPYGGGANPQQLQRVTPFIDSGTWDGSSSTTGPTGRFRSSNGSMRRGTTGGRRSSARSMTASGRRGELSATARRARSSPGAGRWRSSAQITCSTSTSKR